MPHCLIKDPTGKYAIWSTVVDDFLLLDATAEEAIEHELESVHYLSYPGGKQALEAGLRRELQNIEDTGRAWAWSPTWDRAIEIVCHLHGDEAESLRILRDIGRLIEKKGG